MNCVVVSRYRECNGPNYVVECIILRYQVPHVLHGFVWRGRRYFSFFFSFFFSDVINSEI